MGSAQCGVAARPRGVLVAATLTGEIRVRAARCRPCHRYEQLKWAPILVGMLLVLVPLSLDGETLNRFTFSLLFQGLYFRTWSWLSPLALRPNSVSATHTQRPRTQQRLYPL